ncbi:hypothetical protein ABBQ32_007590 [Trebouxia sp. C0010 RCD-2024]
MAKERRPKAISPFTPYIQGNSKFILGLKNVFSEQECQELIHRSEQHVYESALVNFGGTGYVVDKTARDSDRVMLDDPTAAAEIFCRVRPWVPEHIDGCNVCGVNERLRFLRYNAAQQFAPHYDGCYERPDGRELSFLTIQVYLNGHDLEGGETTFFDDEGNEQCKIRPYARLVVLFDHNILHEGSPVTAAGGSPKLWESTPRSRKPGSQTESSEISRSLVCSRGQVQVYPLKTRVAMLN